ncbi:MAG: radical SAM protein [Desulfobacteraceae bacterium]|jgi:Fe-coproporphyrin III synthase
MAKTVAFAKDTANVFFHILTQCNLGCRHCYINPGQHGTQKLSLERIETWLRILIQRSPSANLIFLGGEPTLHPELPAAVRVARRLGYASITIDTNGYLFNNILHKVTPEDVDVVSFSLDGPTAEINDAVRGSGCFTRCTDGIRRAKSFGFDVSLIYTVSSRNLAFLEDMAPLLAKWGVDHFFIQVIGLRGRSAVGSEEDAPLQVTRAQWRDTIPAVARRVADQGIPVTYPKVFLESSEPFYCAGRVADNYFVFPNGRVYRCPLCEDYPLHSLAFVDDRLVAAGPINEADLFNLDIAEGCVMNKLVQPHNLDYLPDGLPAYKIACCLLKERIE